MDSSWKNLQIRIEAAWNMRTTPKTKRPKTGDIISSAHSLDWNKKKVRQLQQQWSDEVTKLVADRNKAISDVMVDILTLIRMDIKSASSVLISHEAAKLLWEKAYEYGHANGFTDVYCAIENYEEVGIEALKCHCKLKWRIFLLRPDDRWIPLFWQISRIGGAFSNSRKSRRVFAT